jgi:Flp pilus assembly pilin Flp
MNFTLIASSMETRSNTEMWMSIVIAAVGRLVARDEGQDLLEYGLLAVLIAIAAVFGVGVLGDTVKTVLWQPIVQNF